MKWYGDIKFHLVVFIISVAQCAAAQTWHNVGNAGFSDGAANYTSLAVDTHGTPYVVYQDVPNGNKATVVRYVRGAGWQSLGNNGVSAGAAYYTSIVVDAAGTPYIAYQDAANGNKATVLKYDGTSWNTLGTAGFTPGQAFDVSMAIDANGKLYVVYQDYSNSGKASVMTFNGTSWTTVGSKGFSGGQVGYTHIAINSVGEPYVVYEDFAIGNRATVMKYNGTAWVLVGIAGFSAAAANYTTIAIDKNDTPFVAFNQSGANVFKYNGSSWVQVGFPRFSNSEAYTTLAIADSGVLYVAGADLNYSSRAFVSVYDTTIFHTWTSVSGSASTDAANYTSLALDKQGTPHLAYSDERNGFKASVMVFSIVSGIEEETSQNELQVYPNPSTGNVNVISKVGGTFKLVNMLGQNIKTMELVVNTPTSLCNLPKGFYLLTGMGVVKKVVVQ